MAQGGRLKLADLDDFIGASQDCVVTLIQPKSGEKGARIDLGDTAAELKRPNLIRSTPAKAPAASTSSSASNTAPKAKTTAQDVPAARSSSGATGTSVAAGDAAPAPEPTTVATVSLSDCLACSGCVTSSEAVMLEATSLQTMLDVLVPKTAEDCCKAETSAPAKPLFSIPENDDDFCGHNTATAQPPLEVGKPRVFVVSVSQESLASLAERYQVSMFAFLQRLRTLLLQKGGFRSQVYVVDTFVSHRVFASRMFSEVDKAQRKDNDSTAEKMKNIQLLSSHCPGWTCYAEKVADKSVVPLLARVRSPMQTQGVLVKRAFMGRLRSAARRAWLGDARGGLLNGSFAEELAGAAGLDLYLNGRGGAGASSAVSGSLPSECCGESAGKPLSTDEIVAQLLDPALECYHVGVAPCSDRKVESFRAEFAGLTPDLVLATRELEDLLPSPEEFAALDPAPVFDVLLREVFALSREEPLAELLAKRKDGWLDDADAHAGQGAASVDCEPDAEASPSWLASLARTLGCNVLPSEQPEAEATAISDSPASWDVPFFPVRNDPNYARRDDLGIAYGYKNVQNAVRKVTQGAGAAVGGKAAALWNDQAKASDPLTYCTLFSFNAYAPTTSSAMLSLDWFSVFSLFWTDLSAHS